MSTRKTQSSRSSAAKNTAASDEKQAAPELTKFLDPAAAQPDSDAADEAHKAESKKPAETVTDEAAEETVDEPKQETEQEQDTLRILILHDIVTLPTGHAVKGETISVPADIAKRLIRLEAAEEV